MTNPRTLDDIDFSDPRLKEPWPDRFVEWDLPSSSILENFRYVLDSAQDERRVQEFLETYPLLLALAFPIHNCWVFPRPRLGGGIYIPDFLFCDRSSLGYEWTLIELESPRLQPTTKRGSISRTCHHAIEQIGDYRRWLRDNGLFEEQRGFKGLNADCDAWVLIGRCDVDRTVIARQRLADLRNQKIEIASYDRLLTRATKSVENHIKLEERVKSLKQKIEKVNRARSLHQ